MSCKAQGIADTTEHLTCKVPLTPLPPLPLYLWVPPTPKWLRCFIEREGKVLLRIFLLCDLRMDKNCHALKRVFAFVGLRSNGGLRYPFSSRVLSEINCLQESGHRPKTART